MTGAEAENKSFGELQLPRNLRLGCGAGKGRKMNMSFIKP